MCNLAVPTQAVIDAAVSSATQTPPHSCASAEIPQNLAPKFSAELMKMLAQLVMLR